MTDKPQTPDSTIPRALVGAVGVTGDTSDNDAAVAMAGIEAVGLVGEA